MLIVIALPDTKTCLHTTNVLHPAAFGAHPTTAETQHCISYKQLLLDQHQTYDQFMLHSCTSRTSRIYFVRSRFLASCLSTRTGNISLSTSCFSFDTVSHTACHTRRRSYPSHLSIHTYWCFPSREYELGAHQQH